MNYLKHVLSEIRQFGFKTAWYNMKFNWAYKHLDAKSMKIVTKKK